MKPLDHVWCSYNTRSYPKNRFRQAVYVKGIVPVVFCVWTEEDVVKPDLSPNKEGRKFHNLKNQPGDAGTRRKHFQQTIRVLYFPENERGK